MASTPCVATKRPPETPTGRWPEAPQNQEGRFRPTPLRGFRSWFPSVRVRARRPWLDPRTLPPCRQGAAPTTHAALHRGFLRPKIKRPKKSAKNRRSPQDTGGHRAVFWRSPSHAPTARNPKSARTTRAGARTARARALVPLALALAQLARTLRHPESPGLPCASRNAGAALRVQEEDPERIKSAGKNRKERKDPPSQPLADSLMRLRPPPRAGGPTPPFRSTRPGMPPAKSAAPCSPDPPKECQRHKKESAPRGASGGASPRLRSRAGRSFYWASPFGWYESYFSPCFAHPSPL